MTQIHSQWKAFLALKGKMKPRLCNFSQSTMLLHPEETLSFLLQQQLPWSNSLQRELRWLNQTVFKCKQSAGQGQTVNNQSRPFKCQLSRKQVQKWRRIWTVAEQTRSRRLATPKNNSAPSECHPVEPHCSTEALKAAIQSNQGGKKTMKNSTETTWWFNPRPHCNSWEINVDQKQCAKKSFYKIY